MCYHIIVPAKLFHSCFQSSITCRSSLLRRDTHRFSFMLAIDCLIGLYDEVDDCTISCSTGSINVVLWLDRRRLWTRLPRFWWPGQRVYWVELSAGSFRTTAGQFLESDSEEPDLEYCAVTWPMRKLSEDCYKIIRYYACSRTFCTLWITTSRTGSIMR